MARRTLTVLVVAALVVVASALVIMWQRRPDTPRPAEGSAETYAVTDVPVRSPDVRISVGTVKWTHHPNYTDWSCLIECREAGGCHAEIQLIIEYVASGVAKRLTLGGRLDAARGETVRIGRVERPGEKVDRVDQVSVEVVEAFQSGAPPPTPME